MCVACWLDVGLFFIGSVTTKIRHYVFYHIIIICYNGELLHEFS